MATGTDQAINSPTVLLLGASSQIGVFAIPQLIHAGFHVLAVSRKGKPEGYPVFEQADWLNEADAIQAAQNCQYLLSAGPMYLVKKFLTTDRNQVTPGTTTPVTSGTGLTSRRASLSSRDSSASLGSIQGPFKTAIIFSSSSVETKRASDNPAERDQIQGMLALESDLQRIAENKGIKLVIFRPTLIYGCGLDTNISLLAKWIKRFGFMPLNGGASGLRQPVHAQDLASAAITAMLSNDDLPRMMFLTGGDTLSYSDMVVRIFAAMKKPVRLVRLPEWLFIFLIRGAHFFRAGRAVNCEMVRRQQLDLVFDDQQARALLNYDPRPFAPVSDDFSLPEFQQDALANEEVSMKAKHTLVPSEQLESCFQSNSLAYIALEPLSLGFGDGNKQYRFYSYPPMAPDETMGIFFEWHTEDFFEVDTGPHIAIGLRGPTETQPHEGRGLAIGILANQVSNPEDPDNPIPLFRGCPDPPGGPSFFIEDFTRNDGKNPIPDWQLSPGKELPQLKGNSTYRINVQVSFERVWVGIWQVIESRAGSGDILQNYVFLGQAEYPDEGFGLQVDPGLPSQLTSPDQGSANAFIGTGFADPQTRSWIDNIYLSHWKSRA